MGGNQVIYKNTDTRAITAMERHRLTIDEENITTVICPVCGEENDDFLYINGSHVVIGCEKCIEKIYIENMF